MPFRDQSHTITGGCLCRAIRYSINVPPLEQRPLHPASHADDPVHLPFIATDHCNDCRKSTASILPAFICAQLDIVTTSVVEQNDARMQKDAQGRGGALLQFDGWPSRSPMASEDGSMEHEMQNRTAHLPAVDVFAPYESTDLSSASFLTYFESSPGKRRYFCSRCGVPIAYMAVDNYLDGFPLMLDVYLGTADRVCLENLEPERELWVEYGIEWICRWAREGGNVPRHGDWNVGTQVYHAKQVGSLESDPGKGQ